MKTEIKNKVQRLMDSRSEAIKDLTGKINAWKQNTVYSDDYKNQKIKELQKEIERHHEFYNKQLKEVIVSEKAAIIGTPEAKPADYQMQIANALEFIKLAGNNLTDEQAHNILKPFKTDYETMSLFKAAINGLTESKGVYGSFNQTFGKTNRLMALINSFNHAENLSELLFDSKNSGLKDGVGVGMFMNSINDISKLAEALEA